jgi:redox-sensing transcriptional repressor
VGEEINNLPVRHIDELEQLVAEHAISIAVIATPVHAAQNVADRLVAAGVTSILNFAPCVLAVPDNVDVRKVDLAIELQILSFHEHRKASSANGRAALESAPTVTTAKVAAAKIPGAKAKATRAAAAIRAVITP